MLIGPRNTPWKKRSTSTDPLVLMEVTTPMAGDQELKMFLYRVPWVLHGSGVDYPCTVTEAHSTPDHRMFVQFTIGETGVPLAEAHLGARRAS